MAHTNLRRLKDCVSGDGSLFVVFVVQRGVESDVIIQHQNIRSKGRKQRKNSQSATTIVELVSRELNCSFDEMWTSDIVNGRVVALGQVDGCCCWRLEGLIIKRASGVLDITKLLLISDIILKFYVFVYLDCLLNVYLLTIDIYRCVRVRTRDIQVSIVFLDFE